MTLRMTMMALPLLLVAAPALAAPDSQFLNEAMQGDNGEVALGRMAIQKGGSAKVRDFGKMLVDDHGAHKKQVVALGSAMKLSATDSLTPDAAKARDMLAKASGADFDRMFKQHMIEDHQKDIAKYEAQVKDSQSAGVRTLAQQTLPTLRKHLATAQAL